MILSHCHPKHSFITTLNLLHHGIIDRFAVVIDVLRLAILQTYLVNIRYEALEQSQFKFWGMWSVPPCIEQQAGVEKKAFSHLGLIHCCSFSTNGVFVVCHTPTISHTRGAIRFWVSCHGGLCTIRVSLSAAWKCQSPAPVVRHQ